jgi:hypothetical protein
MIRQYILLAAGCIVVGVILTFAMLVVVQRLGLDLERNLWLVAIPAVFSVLLNIGLVEIFHAYRRKR